MTDTENTPAVEAETAAPPAPNKAASSKAASGTDVPPDHLCIHPWSAHHDADKLARGIGIRFKGAVRTNVEEYSISEGWIKVQAGKSLDRKGRPMLLTLKGPVEAWYEDLGDDAPVAK
jgi:Protein of unknown function (DUF3297)